jgi:hypothetical protein
VKEQLNVRLDAALARLVKQEAQEQCRTVGGIVALALEAWLSKASSDLAGASSSPDQQALAALEARVAKLEAANQGTVRTLKNNDESRASVRMSKAGSDSTRLINEGLTTAELAIQTSTNKAAWNTWASKATIGDIRRHPQAGSWRLLGKAAPASGGPPRWLWEQA